MLDRLHAKAAELDLADFEDPAWQDVWHRAQAEAPVRTPRILAGLTQLAQGALALALMAGLLTTFNVFVALAVIAAAAPGAWLRTREARRLEAWQRAAAPARAVPVGRGVPGPGPRFGGDLRRVHVARLAHGRRAAHARRARDVRAGGPARAGGAPDPVRRGRRALRGPALSRGLRRGARAAASGPGAGVAEARAALLCRFHDPDAGRILLDGTDLREFRTADLRRALTALFQDFVRYELTLAENIRLGDPAAPEEGIDARVRDAVRAAGLEEFAAGLPEGLATRLGRRFAGGHEPSAGLWQRIALARAFFRDAPIVLLDEPLAALDPEAEAAFAGRAEDLFRGRTALVVSHRFSAARAAGRILVLDAGRIVESGTHAELAPRSGPYARLFSAQARPFR